MSKKITIEYIKEVSKSSYDLTLISKYYIDNKHKLEWIDNKTGIKFYRNWNDIKSGKLSPNNPHKKLKIDDIKRIAINKYGLILKSSYYIDNKHKLEWVDSKTGISFSRSWNSITSGSVTPKKINDYERDKSKIENYKGLGYKYTQTKAQYMSAPRKGSSRLFVIEHPLLSEVWVTTLENFLKCASTYLNRVGTSYGELIIHSLLNSNNINFTPQYSVRIKGNTHRFDFYLPDFNLFIEYDGRQHYESVDYFGGRNAFEERKIRDAEKSNYVSSVNASLLRIPYTVDTEGGILEVLSKELNKKLVPIKDYDYFNIVREVAAYYDNNSVTDTQRYYNISRSTVYRYYSKVYNMTKSKKHRLETSV